MPGPATVIAMGLAFANPLGLAAGFDRTGELLPALGAHGFGHVEIGTMTPATIHSCSLRRAASGPRIGINIGSGRPGLYEQVIDDYAATLRQVSTLGDYVVANLSSPVMGRNGDTPGVEALVQRLSATRDTLRARSGRRVPLLLKLEAGPDGAPFPAAMSAAKRHGLDGIVLVSASLPRIAAACEHLEGLPVISVGGIKSEADMNARLDAGAALVQIHTAFACDGAASVRRILKDA